MTFVHYGAIILSSGPQLTSNFPRRQPPPPPHTHTHTHTHTRTHTHTASMFQLEIIFRIHRASSLHFATLTPSASTTGFFPTLFLSHTRCFISSTEASGKGSIQDAGLCAYHSIMSLGYSCLTTQMAFFKVHLALKMYSTLNNIPMLAC